MNFAPPSSLAPPHLSVNKAFTLSSESAEILCCVPFDLRGVRTVLLEGDNGSGKSVFVKYLTGNLPHSINSDQSDIWNIDGRNYAPVGYEKAKREGIVAVYQDDDLISTFSVLEHFILQHHSLDNVTLLKLIVTLGAKFILTVPAVISELLATLRVREPKNWLTKLEKKIYVDLGQEEEIERKAKNLFVEFGWSKEDTDELFTKKPPQLFGGARALTKICNALLCEDIKVLILDEAFSGVQKGTWQKCIDKIKELSVSRNFMVINITHNQEEKEYWKADKTIQISLSDCLGSANTMEACTS